MLEKVKSSILNLGECEKHINYLLLRYLRNGLYSRIGIPVEKKHITDLCWIVSMDLLLELLGQIHCGICISIRDIICYMLRKKMGENYELWNSSVGELLVWWKRYFWIFSLFCENFI